jgi:aminoglycoside/choline kinase family phosphotransferase
MRGADFCTGLRQRLQSWREPGVAELCAALQELMGKTAESARTVRLQRFQEGVYRVRIGSQAGANSVILKRHEPATAQRDRLTIGKWLPRLGLGDRCPRLLAAAAERQGLWVWHVYEDLGNDTLAVHCSRETLQATIDLISELHSRSARHPLLPEVRRQAPDHGIHFFHTAVRDAIDALEGLHPGDRNVPAESATAQARLLEHLHDLLEDAPRRARAMENVGGPDILLHGDLWPENVFMARNGRGFRARLIDWDHVSVGPSSYDVSTVLYRVPAGERTWVLDRYRDAVAKRGLTLPANAELNLLFHTAESARCASCIPWPVMALKEGAEWGARHLVEIERWFEVLRPPLPDGSR